MPEPMPTGDRRIELFVREELPEPTQERKRELADTLARLDGDVIDDYEVQSIPKRSLVEDSTADGLYVSLREWAREAGVELSPFFDTRMCYSTETAEIGCYRVMPAFCLVVYEGDEIEAAYPHRDEETNTVMDGLQAVAAAEALPTRSNRAEPSVAD